MREPRRDHYIAPTTGEDSRAALDAAIESLGKLRGLEWSVTPPSRCTSSPAS